MRFLRVGLEASERRLAALTDFYAGELGFELVGRHSLAVGETTLEFAASSAEPFYHFALLVPGNRFDAALNWARSRADLLPDPDSGELVFDFENWSASALYFLDPAGNIVELIAHRGLDESNARGEFHPSELVGLSELGLVGDPAGMAASLTDRLGLELWDGTIDEPGRIAFVGRRARTLILSPPGRGWLPTRRAAEACSVTALLAGPVAGAVELERSLYRISAVSA